LLIVDSGKQSKKGSKKWDWRKDFAEIVKAKSGLLKIHFPKPSTAYIGNWGILESVKFLSEQYGYGSCLSARLFMGKKKLTKSKFDFPLSIKDSIETIQLQWEGLK
jgi:hypothetical protein